MSTVNSSRWMEIPDRGGRAVVSCLALALTLGGCGSDSDLVPAHCLPGAAPAAGERLGAVDALDIYLDVSQSSTNFGRARGESPYRNLIAWLVDVRGEFAESRSYGFAERIAEIDQDVFVGAARGNVNPCRACGLQESRLDDVLAAIASPDARGSLAVVVTDLWLDNSDLIGSARLALQRPIRSILADGRAIGVLGVAAPYSGQVYDLPESSGSSSIRAGRVEQRPVFALVVGPPDQVVEIERRITGEIFMNAAAAERHFSLFSPALGTSGPVEHRLQPRAAGVRRDWVLAVEGAEIPGFLIDRRTVDPLLSEDADPGPALVAPIAAGDHPGAPKPADYELAVDAWTLVPPQPSVACNDGAWLPIDMGRAFEQFTDTEDRPAIALDAAHPDLLAIRPGEIAFVRYHALVTSFQRGGPATSWLDDWSFDESGARDLAVDPPPFFPTLNLSEFGRILEVAMDELVAGETVASGSVLLSVE